MATAGIQKVDDLHSMLRACDFVSIHSGLNDSTHDLISRAELACLKQRAFLINTARGGLVDEEAMVEAVLEGRLGGVGLDVYTEEPLARTGHPLSPLYERDNVILFTHLTFFTKEALQRLEADTLVRCDENLANNSVTIRAHDPRLRAQTSGVSVS